MGRKTWDSLGRPLPGRSNIVISRNPDFHAEGATLVPTLQAAIDACGSVEEAFVIGGAQIYAQALPLAQRVLATEVHAQVEGDAFFPLLPAFLWKEVARASQPAENGYAYDFVTYERA
ncbi:Dihydrofolate reductase type 3 [compost metagenome]